METADTIVQNACNGMLTWIKHLSAGIGACPSEVGRGLDTPSISAASRSVARASGMAAGGSTVPLRRTRQIQFLEKQGGVGLLQIHAQAEKAMP